MIRGAYKYNPRELLEELEKIKINLKVPKDSEAFKKIAEYSRIGREVKFTIDFNINRGRKR